MSENLTDRFLRPHRLDDKKRQKPEFKEVTNFKELNATLRAFEARLTTLETDMYKRGWEQRQNEADHDALLKRHNGLVKTHDENVRDIERDFEAIEAKAKEFQSRIC